MNYEEIVNTGRFFRILTDREREIILLKYGFIDGEVKSSSETARKLSISRERVRQLEESSKKKIETIILYEK